MLQEFDRIRLKNGDRGSILELFDDGTYLAEIFKKSGEVDVTEIKITDIKAKIVEMEEPLLV